MAEQKRFEEWEQVNCNECARWWDSSCDGVCKGDKKVCMSYVATRSVVIPAQIKRLTKVVKGLVWSVSFIIISLIFHYLSVMGWL